MQAAQAIAILAGATLGSLATALLLGWLTLAGLFRLLPHAATSARTTR